MWTMQRHPTYYHSKRIAFQSLPVRFTLRTCVTYSKTPLSQLNLYKYRRHFLQKFLARTSTLMQWKCLNSAYNLCYIYGEVMFPLQKRVINPITRNPSHIYFVCHIWDQTKRSAPHVVCNTCAANLRNLQRRKRQLMFFATPLVRRHRTNRISACCFCTESPFQ
jgi:hypothetical protein